MVTKKSLVLSVLLVGILIFLVMGIGNASAATATVCAEKTVSGAWCQNVPEDQADGNYRIAQTSCSSTSFCKSGTCVDSFEGLCQRNTPQRVCQENGGVWNEKDAEEISQCNLGCCFIGDGASFVTQTRCSTLSAAYGVNTDFDRSISSEAACIVSAFPQEKGACVIDDGFRTNCKLTTRKECQDLQGKSGDGTDIEFNAGFLCSAEALGAVCGPSERTTLIDGKDGVYFMDSCGNPANIYDASRVDDQDYWTKIISPDDSCEVTYNEKGEPTNSANCGNCNYFDGSIGKTYVRGGKITPTKPRYGNYVCADLSCEWEGETYEHGEAWCTSTAASSSLEDNPGAEDARLVCQFGEVTVESCTIGSPVGRNKVCVQGKIEDGTADGYSTAQCRLNRWRDCTIQDNKDDCENLDQRDCKWLPGVSILGQGGFVGQGATPFVVNAKGELEKRDNYNQIGAACVPKNAPGYYFWDAESQAQTETQKTTEEACLIASRDCVVKFQKGILPGSSWSCKENCDCIDPSWASRMNNMCVALGDCGVAENFAGKQGDNELTDDLYKVTKGVSADGS